MEKIDKTWNFAAFDYVGLGKPTLWHRIKVAWKYMIKGEMHKYHVILNDNEAKRLSEFIEQNNFAKRADRNVNVMLPDLDIHEAQELAMATDYAVFAVEDENNKINTADAAAFFLEGYNHAKGICG